MIQDEALTAPRRPQHRVDWAALRHDAGTANWAITNGRAGLLCIPVIAAWVFFGILGDAQQRTQPAVLAIAGAVAVGFGTFQTFDGGHRRLRWMSITLVGITAATWVGCVAGHFGWGWLVLAVAAVGYGFGAMSMLGQGAFWIGLQWTIALLVYGSHPAAPRGALDNAGFVAAGGLSQLFFLTPLLPFTDRWFRRSDVPALAINGLSVAHTLRRNLNPATPGGRYALRVAIALTAAETVYHLLDLPHGYWAPMTAAVLIRPDAHDSTVRALCRFGGTLAGAGLATLAVAIGRPTQPQLGAILLVAVWACFALQRVNYGIFSACITAYVVLLLSALGLPQLDVTSQRVTATLIGAAIALAIHTPPLRFLTSDRAPSDPERPDESRAL